MDEKKEHYGLLTATTMIIGIVIGSGIFFKGDDVLKSTGGNVWLGVIAFCIGAFSIVFGSLTLTELSIRTKKNGGIVGYYEEFVSNNIASGFGWFQTFVYYPTISAVVAWVAAIYACTLFDIKATLEIQIAIGLIIMVLLYAINILSLKLGGYFQNLATIIKMIPLFGIAILGIVYGVNNPQNITQSNAAIQSNIGFGWIASLAPIAFSYDGWIIALSVTNEVKNPKKNMPLALIIGPFVVLTVYVLYFLGLSSMLGVDYILSAGDDAVNKAGQFIFGNNGAKIMLIFVSIAVLGVLNGIILGALRMPQALASKQMIPAAKKIAVINPKIHLSVSSSIVSFVLAVFWMLMHYITMKTKIMGNGDISEISIVFSYVCYTILYIKVLQMKKRKIINSNFKGVICPILAIIGSAIILIGGIVSNPIYVPIFIAFCSIITIIGFLYKKASKDSINFNETMD